MVDLRLHDAAALWAQLGLPYTAHGALMVAGGLMFGWSLLRAHQLPRWATGLFTAGLAVNLAFGLLPGPAILQTIGSAVRNAGLVAMGWAVLAGAGPQHAWPIEPATD